MPREPTELGSSDHWEQNPIWRFLVEMKPVLFCARLTALLRLTQISQCLPRYTAVALATAGILGPAKAADFNVSTPGFFFQINGSPAPKLILLRGHTYTFNVATDFIHPFHIESPGAINNNINSGTITYTVPTNNANYYYDCVIHGAAMRGEIQTVAEGDFLVTTPDDQFAFNINGQDGPALTLVRGKTYKFSVLTSAGFHPFHIESPGVDVNDIDNGMITYTVPMAATNYYYNCTVHGDSMRGEITTVAPPAPPEIRILNLTVGTNLVLRFTGTNSLSFAPEYSTNLNSTNWFALTVQTNRSVNGTNEAICGKPPGNNVNLRIRAQ